MADDASRRHSSSVDSPSTVVTTPDADLGDDDVWASDNDQRHDQTNSRDTREDLLSDLPIVRRQHMTDGYREGLSVGKGKVMQKGFDVGYPVGISIALRVGKILGCFEGILASKNVSDEVKARVKVMLEEAKQELAVTTFLKGVSDEDIMQFDGIPDHVQTAIVNSRLFALASNIKDFATIYVAILSGKLTPKNIFYFNWRLLYTSPAEYLFIYSCIFLVQSCSMVRFKGIHISAIAQLDIRPLPEYHTACASDTSGNVAACYLLIQSGTQLWFEYSIDGPHPKNAMYFFKFLFDGQNITSWDCTEKHDYHGKVAYCLHTVKTPTTGERAVVQQSFRFSAIDGRTSPNSNEDCIEIRVHRVQHRRRLREFPLDHPIPRLDNNQKALRLMENGLIEDCRPARKYQYQLLDAKDIPFATFRFYCRTKDFLLRHQIFPLNRSSSLTSTVTSESQYFDVDTSPEQHNGNTRLQEAKCEKPLKHPNSLQPSNTEKDALPLITENSIQCPTSSTYIPRSASASSVVSRIKDSVEDLPSLVRRVSQCERPAHKFSKTSPNDTVPMSPTLPHKISQAPLRSQGNSSVSEACGVQGKTSHTTSPTRLPHQRHKRNKPGLLFNLNDTVFEIEHKKMRPLSPFTSGGFLRRLVSNPEPEPEPLSASATGTEVSDVNRAGTIKHIGLSSLSKDGEEQQNGDGTDKSLKPTQVQRGVFSFKSFLSRTFERKRATQ